MKLLEICRSYYPSTGGLEKFISQRIEIYKELKIDYKILTTNFNTGKIQPDFNSKDIIYFNQYTKYNISPSFDRTFIENFDIISINQVGNYLSDVAILIASKLKKKIILTPHLYFHTNRYKIIKLFHEKMFLIKLLKKVDNIICFTDYEVDYWSNRFPFIKSKLLKIPHYFSFGEKPKMINFGKKNRNYILYLGRFSKNKKIELLIEAFNLGKELNFDLYLTIDENEIDYRLRKKINKDNRIKLLGYISEAQKYEYLRDCEALILPTDYEAFGIVCFEASRFNKPLLCSNIKIFEEILDDGGVIYFDNNLESLSKALKKFNEYEPSELKIMGQVNKSNLANYSFERIAERYYKLLRSLMD